MTTSLKTSIKRWTSSRPLEATRRFAHSLWRNRAGNVAIIAAIAVFPLMAAIGGSVDMSRAYMARAKMNQACDSTALAARRAMVGTNIESAENAQVRTDAAKFFHFNYPRGYLGSAPLQPIAGKTGAPSIYSGGTGVVRVGAQVEVPTTLMRLFGSDTTTVAIACESTQNFDNIDVMLVLDTTGSMDGQRIIDLRSAVMAFYNELAPAQAQLTSQGLRLRYGIVPYSSTVNVGFSLGAGQVRSDSWNYQSRVAEYKTAITVTVDSSTAPFVWEIHPNSISKTQCSNYGKASAATTTVDDGDSDPNTWTQVSTSYSNNTDNDWGWSSAGDRSGSDRSCRRRATSTTTDYEKRFKWTRWLYKMQPYQTTDFVAGNSVPLALGSDGTVKAPGEYNPQQLAAAATDATITNHSWDGCIEERSTVSTITSSTPVSPIPTGALDLNIDTVPSDDNSRWQPMLRDLVWDRSSSTNGSKPSGEENACPTPARKLAVMTQAEMQAAVNLLSPKGYTYHDIGMIWGARFISRNGIFAADNPSTFGDRPVSRYIIFMTDGEQNANDGSYSAWGIEPLDKRISGTYTGDADLESRHAKRFQMACNEARGLGAQIWAIQFDSATTVNQTLVSCTGSLDRTALVTNGPALIAKFKEIGKNIGTLRLSK